jgi:hypothetical protein
MAIMPAKLMRSTASKETLMAAHLENFCADHSLQSKVPLKV